MKAHDWFVEHRGDYVIRALEVDDERLFKDHLGRCKECDDAIQEITTDLAMMPMGVQPVAPRPRFSHQVMADLTGGRITPRRQWLVPVLSAASLVVAFGLTTTSRRHSAELDRQLSQLQVSYGAVMDTLSVLRQTSKIAQASINQGGMEGGMVIFADEVSHRWNVVVHGIPTPGDDETYIFWFITDDGMVLGAEVICDEDSPAILTLEMPPGATGIRGGALTLERTLGRSGTAEGPELAHLEL